MEPPAGPQENVQARPAPQAPPSLQLHYATPKPAGPWQTGPDAPILRALRQVVFATGFGLLMFGVVSAWARVNTRDAPVFAGWGAGFVALATPLWRVRKDD